MSPAPNLRLIPGGAGRAHVGEGHYYADPFPGVEAALRNAGQTLLKAGGTNPYDLARVGLAPYSQPYATASNQANPFEAPKSPEQPKKDDLYRHLAPWPAVDRVPIVIGQHLSIAYVTAAMRLCTQGWRYQFVDCLNELVEHDPHMRGVLRQRIVPVAGARVELKSAILPKTASQGDKDKAEEIRWECERQLSSMTRRTQSLAALAWGAWFGLAGSEIDWRPGRVKGIKWEAAGLNFIHSRRLNLPRVDTWDVHVWDQGLVGPGISNFGYTSGPYGLRCDDFPGKFVLHAPQLNADYLTRDGEGRYCATYMLLKRMCVRATAQDFERVIRPWIVGYFKRDAEGDGKEELALPGDINTLQSAVQNIGNGALNTAVLSDACSIEILRAASAYPLPEFLEFLDGAMAKAVLGQTYTTSPGAHGNHAVAEVAKDCMLDVLRYDARCLADTLERGLLYWIVRLNWPGLEDTFLPQLTLNVDEETQPKEFAEVALSLTKMDVPVDVKKLAERCGIDIVDVGAEDYDPRESPRTRMVVPHGMDSSVQPDAGSDPNQEGEDATPPPQPPGKPGEKTPAPTPPQAAQKVVSGARAKKAVEKTAKGSKQRTETKKTSKAPPDV